MRRWFPAAISALVLVPAAFGALGGATEDGTLSIRDGNGVFVFNVKGSVLGRVDKGQIEVYDKNPDDAREPEVRGADRTRAATEHKTIFSGKKIRFRIVGGSFRTKISALGVDVSAVGRGVVTMNAYDDSANPGEYSLNLEDYELVPWVKRTVRLESE
jgi:hypothetical protein